MAGETNATKPPRETPMHVPAPRFVLFSETSRIEHSGRWRFRLQAADGSQQFEAIDVEPEARGDRLELLTVIRGLEALDQPSEVTLVGSSPYIRQGMTYGLSEWRDNGWRWEFFGQMVPLKNGDLWQRLDRALRFHRVDCRRGRFDEPDDPPSVSAALGNKREYGKSGIFGIHLGVGHRLECWLGSVPAKLRRWTAALLRGVAAKRRPAVGGA